MNFMKEKTRTDRKKNSLMMLGIILAVFAVAGMVMVGAGAADDPVHVTDEDELREALIVGGTVVMDNDIKISSTLVVGAEDPYNVTLDLNGHVLYGSNTFTKIMIGNNVIFTLEDSSPSTIHIFEYKKPVNLNLAWVYYTDGVPEEGDTVKVYNSVTAFNKNEADTFLGKSTENKVYIKVNGGVITSDATDRSNNSCITMNGNENFVMNSGNIIGNSNDKCGAVEINSGNFIFNGGRIAGNVGNQTGGVCVNNGSTFTIGRKGAELVYNYKDTASQWYRSDDNIMNNGEMFHDFGDGNGEVKINADNVLSTGWGDYILNDGNYLLMGNLELSAVISIGGNVKLDLNGHVINANGQHALDIKERTSLGLYDCETDPEKNTNVPKHYFKVNGEIPSEKVAGLWVWDDSAVMSPCYVVGGLITGSKLSAVSQYSESVFEMNGGNIAGNEGTISGAILMDQECFKSTFNLKGGSIQGNKGDDTGGIYIYNQWNTETQYNHINLLGGSIECNLGEECGGVNSIENFEVKWINLGGSLKIKNNVGKGELENNLNYNASVNSIDAAGFNDDACVGVTSKLGPREVTYACDTDYSGFFFSDDPAYFIEYKADKKIYLLDSTERADINRVASVSVTPEMLTMSIGGTSTLTSTVVGKDATKDPTNPKVYWSSSNENIATVDQTGKVTAKGAGKVTITAKSMDGGITDICDVVVYPDNLVYGHIYYIDHTSDFTTLDNWAEIDVLEIVPDAFDPVTVNYQHYYPKGTVYFKVKDIIEEYKFTDKDIYYEPGGTPAELPQDAMKYALVNLSTNKIGNINNVELFTDIAFGTSKGDHTKCLFVWCMGPDSTVIRFDDNGADEALPLESQVAVVQKDGSYVLPKIGGITKTGYHVEENKEWINDEGTVAKAGEKFTPTKNCTWKINWVANTYTVTLDKNGGTGGTETVTATYDAAMPALTSLPAKDGCNFLGYFDDAGTMYYNKDGSSARTWDKTNTDTLKAHWEKRGIYISETSISFGTIEQGEPAPKSKVLTIQNTTTDKTYTISYDRSGAFEYDKEPSGIGPGETLNIEITPIETKVGDYSDTITITGEGDIKETVISYSIIESGTSEKETVPDTPDVKTEEKLNDDGTVSTEITAEGDDSNVEFDPEELTATVTKENGNVVLTYTKATRTGEKSFEAGDGYTETAKYMDEAIIKADLQETPTFVPYTLSIVLKENISSTEIPRMSGEFKYDVSDIVAKNSYTALTMVTAVNTKQLGSINDTIKNVDITFKVPVKGVPDVSNIKVFHVKDEKADEVNLADDIKKDESETHWLVHISTDKGFSSYVIAKKNAAPVKGSTTTSFSGEKSGNDFTFSKAVVVTKATLPNASSAKITNTSGSGWYSFKLDASGMSGNGTVYFQVPLADISLKGKTTSDVSLVGCTTKYLTTENGYAKYSAVIPGEGTYTIDFVDDAATQGTTEQKTEESTSTDTQGYLKVVTTPAGATIQIEGVNYKGTSPQSTIALNPGTYTVTLSLDGYKDASQSFTIKAGETTPVTLSMEKKESSTTKTEETKTTAKSSVPVLGVFAGLGAAVVLRRK